MSDKRLEMEGYFLLPTCSVFLAMAKNIEELGIYRLELGCIYPAFSHWKMLPLMICIAKLSVSFTVSPCFPMKQMHLFCISFWLMEEKMEQMY